MLTTTLTKQRHVVRLHDRPNEVGKFLRRADLELRDFCEKLVLETVLPK